MSAGRSAIESTEYSGTTIAFRPAVLAPTHQRGSKSRRFSVTSKFKPLGRPIRHSHVGAWEREIRPALTTLLWIIALISPCINGAVQSDQSIGPGKSISVSAEALVFDRVGTADRTLVERVPGSIPFIKVPFTRGSQALNSTDFDQGFAPGFRVGATYHADSNYGLELSFFRVSGWDSTRSIGPDESPSWLVMRAPGAFFQTQDFSYQSMTWKYSSDLENGEFNLQYKLSSRIILLAGFRWLQLNEDLQGTIPPPDRTLPTWKYNPRNTLLDVAQIENQPGGIPSTTAYPPFWDSSTLNNLYGLQIGASGRLFELGRFSIDGLIKVGGYLNHASQSTGVSLEKVVYQADASTDRAAFVGEAALQCRYQVSRDLALKVGYQVLWLDGVALAPGQIQETYTIAPATVYSLGVNSGFSVLFHGATTGLEFSF
jgi:hypothetical protein